MRYPQGDSKGRRLQKLTCPPPIVKVIFLTLWVCCAYHTKPLALHSLASLSPARCALAFIYSLV